MSMQNVTAILPIETYSTKHQTAVSWHLMTLMSVQMFVPVCQEISHRTNENSQFLTNLVCATEVPSPPKTITAEIQNGVLNVTWSLPFTRQTYCFEYEVDIGNQVQYSLSLCIIMSVDHFRCNILYIMQCIGFCFT